jgi:hypothetical protein
MKLILQPTGAFATIRAARLRVWRGWTRNLPDADSVRVRAYSTLGPPGAVLASLTPSDEISVYCGVAARIWSAGGRGRVLHLAIVHIDHNEWASTSLARALAALSPEAIASLRLETALAS